MRKINHGLPDPKKYYTLEDFKSLKWCSVHLHYAYYTEDFMSHHHDFFEAFVVISGTATHNIDDKEHQIARGDFFVIKSGTPHGFCDVHELELINLLYIPSISLKTWNELYSIPGFDHIFKNEPKSNNFEHLYTTSLSDDILTYVINSTSHLIKQIDTGSEKNIPVIIMGFQTLLANLAVQFEAVYEETQSLRILTKSINFMNENITEQIQLTDIADNVFISSRHLQRLFNTYYGTTPIHYLTRLRLDNAFKLISEKKYSISEAAIKSGYSDPAYFSRVFKDVYGITPNQTKRFLVL